MIDTYSDISRAAPRAPVAIQAWDSQRSGVVVVQSEFNDMINPWGSSRDARPLSSLAAANYEQTLQASLALLSAERRQDWSSATSRGVWKTSSGPAYLGGSLTYTTQRGAFREMRVTVGPSGVLWLITWEVSTRVSNPRTGATQISRRQPQRGRHPRTHRHLGADLLAAAPAATCTRSGRAPRRSPA